VKKVEGGAEVEEVEEAKKVLRTRR